MRKLILASRSPRRRQILGQFSLDFDIVEPNIDESPLNNERSGQTVFDRLNERHRVLGGDTIVALGNQIFGKPTDLDNAVNMLNQLSGKTHIVLSVVALVDHDGCRSLLSETKVTFATSFTIQNFGILRHLRSV